MEWIKAVFLHDEVEKRGGLAAVSRLAGLRRENVPRIVAAHHEPVIAVDPLAIESGFQVEDGGREHDIIILAEVQTRNAGGLFVRPGGRTEHALVGASRRLGEVDDRWLGERAVRIKHGAGFVTRRSAADLVAVRLTDGRT